MPQKPGHLFTGNVRDPLTTQNRRSTIALSSEKEPTIPILTYRELYDEAWLQLFDLVAQRSALLRNLDTMAKLAMEMTPAAGMVIEFDVSRAEELLAQIEQMTDEISGAMQRANRFAEQCGAPSVKWQNISLRSEK